MGQIFYSEVDANLANELDARAAVATDRTTTALNYMVSKIANVELIAYKNQDVKNQSPNNRLYTLGGDRVRKGNYLPSGFLSDDNVVFNKSKTNTYKVPPFITACDVSINDHSFGLLNSATINIVIPDPIRDIDLIESIFARPGRALTLRIVHPDEAIVVNGYLDASTIQPAIPVKPVNTKINVFEFDGLLTSFNMSYLTDVTVQLTVHARGTSNVYTDVSMLTDPDNTDLTKDTEKLPSDFYEKIHTELKSLVDSLYKKTTEIHLAYQALPDTSEFQELYGEHDQWYFRSNLLWDKQEHYYVQIGLLVRYLNQFILTKQQKFTPGAFIICNDIYCKSNYYEKMISADPDNILILSADVYGKDPTTKQDRHFVDRGGNWKQDTDGDMYTDTTFHDESKSFSYPSRIFINTNVINSIMTQVTVKTKTMNVGEFLTELSKRINSATGGAIDFKLVSHPDNPNYLLYTDRNYLGDKKQITPYNVPMMANRERGSVVRDFKFEAKLPSNMQSLMYTTTNSDNISEEQIAPYMNFMYNNSDKIRIKDDKGRTLEVMQDADGKNGKSESELKSKYKESHEKYLKALEVAKQEFGDTKLNLSKQSQLKAAIQKYIQFPTPDIKTSAQMQSPIYPFDVEFTIDGINGFRYGNCVEFDVLPQKYKNDTTFSIKSITHNVNTTGEWTTVIRCIMQARFDK